VNSQKRKEYDRYREKQIIWKKGTSFNKNQTKFQD